MSLKEEQQKEIDDLHYTLESIEESFNQRRINVDGDSVVPELFADKIMMLLGNV